MRLYALAPEPIDELSRWLEQLSQAWQGQLDAFKDYYGQPAMRVLGMELAAGVKKTGEATAYSPSCSPRLVCGC